MLNYHEMPNKPGIYRFTCLVNGKVYVGQAKNIFKRVRSHLYAVRSNRKAPSLDYILYQAVKKHGLENFTADALEVLNEGNAEWLTRLEYYWFIYLNAHISLSGYNVLIPGCWGNVDQYLSPEKKKSKSEKLSKAHKGHLLSDSTRQRLSESHKGIKQTPEWVEKRISKIRGRTNALKGKKQPERASWILSEKDQRKAFLSNTRTLCLKFKNNYTREICYFYGCQEASRKFNIHRTSLTDVIIRGEIPRRGLKKKIFDEWQWEIVPREELFYHRPDLT